MIVIATCLKAQVVFVFVRNIISLEALVADLQCAQCVCSRFLASVVLYVDTGIFAEANVVQLLGVRGIKIL